ncbi:hypothetical protein BO70DRAFT_196090 [Aspergillus heteromorphus CBS 117.55]|uniref:Uncharacterized protein n=1 Tax=Aspergillus heteromorphus CBS 117.55 TaxID=1448321 RepID=A0A317WQG0_9EURO|nr:uncharacterized protein BO70DRAFT_196090 [Aspergillus heteromorphus CBS 117.55]PWY87522.1 hypothetical protein BO70DRAFT_196090 [Aspergillus heteromorphus CBS 117.55]
MGGTLYYKTDDKKCGLEMLCNSRVAVEKEVQHKDAVGESRSGLTIRRSEEKHAIAAMRDKSRGLDFSLFSGGSGAKLFINLRSFFCFSSGSFFVFSRFVTVFFSHVERGGGEEGGRRKGWERWKKRGSTPGESFRGSARVWPLFSFSFFRAFPSSALMETRPSASAPGRQTRPDQTRPPEPPQRTTAGARAMERTDDASSTVEWMC